MGDRFENFAKLTRVKKEGRHYRIHYRPGDSGILVMAPHGGKIESGTSELVRLISRIDHSVYTFEGIQPYHNFRDLHLTSTRFDEPVAVQAVAAAEHVLTIHGQESTMNQVCFIGGLDQEFANALENALRSIGITVESQYPGLSGESPHNICNRNRRGQGVQLEISKQLRQRLVWDLAGQRRFVETVRNVLKDRAASDRLSSFDTPLFEEGYP